MNCLRTSPRAQATLRFAAVLTLVVALGAAPQLFADTQVIAWGANNWGQTSVPAGLTNVVALAGGGEHSLALNADGTVAAWGMNYYNELNLPGDLTNAVAVSGGGEFSVALRSDGTFNAAGYDAGNQNYPPGWTDGNQVVAVAAGKYAAVSLMADGSSTSWGDTAYYIGYVPPGMTNVVAFAIGWSNAAALKSDGTVVEWTVDTESLSAVPGISNIVAISAGYYHRAGIKSDGTVVAWGDNSYGQTNVPAGLSNVVAIACGGYHTLALKSDGTVVAWGEGSSYAPWDSNSQGQSIVPAGLTNVVAIGAGGLHSLALVSSTPLPPIIITPQFDQTVPGNNTTWFWVGASGLGPFTYQWSLDGTPLAGQTNRYLKLANVQVSDAGAYSVTVSNAFGGTNALMNLNVTPWINVQPLTQSVFAGNTVTFSATSGGLNPGDYRWQFNGTNLPDATNSSLVLTNVQFNQAGTYSVSISNSFGMVTSTNATLSVGALSIATQPQGKATWLGSSARFTVGASGTGPFNYQWRFNGTNLPGSNAAFLLLTNLQMPQFGAYDAIVANAYGSVTSSVATLSYSQVAIWGSITNLPVGLTNVIAIAGGPAALLSNHRVAFWYSGPTLISVPGLSNAVVITGTLASYHMAVLSNQTAVGWVTDGPFVIAGLPGISNVVAVAADNYKDLELRSDGTLAGAALTNAPSAVTNLNNAVAISEGMQHSIALTADGNVIAWGNNTYGQTNVPANLSNVVAIAAGGYHNLALRSDGTVMAWGRYLERETNVPPNLSNVVAVAAGLYHSMALKSDGTVAAWGPNSYGLTNVPSGLTNVVAIAADQYNSLALIGSGPPALQVTLSNLAWTPNAFSFPLPTDSGRVYALEYKNSLDDAYWTPLPLVAGTGGTVILQDSSAVTNSQRFYRVRRW